MRNIESPQQLKLENENAARSNGKSTQTINVTNHKIALSGIKWLLGGVICLLVVTFLAKLFGFGRSETAINTDYSVFSSLVENSDVIHGAFGFELGDFVPEKSEKYKSSAKEVHSGLIKYEIEPDKRIAGFEKYMIYMSPISRKIVMISATGEGIRDGRNIMKQILEKLQKYGKVKEVLIGPDDFYDSRLYIIEQREKYIAVYLDNASSIDIHISFIDRKERENSDKEIEVIKKKNNGFDRL